MKVLIKWVLIFSLFLMSGCYYVEGKISVMQGATSAHETQIHIISAENENLAFFYEDENKKVFQVPESDIIAKKDILKKYSLFKITIKKLKPKHQYTLNIVSQDREALIGRKYFYTMKRDTFRRLAITSCAADFISKDSIQNMWTQLEKLKPDAVLMIGDNAYIDVTHNKLPIEKNPDKFLQRYMDHRFELPYYMMKELIPTYGTWDDHDYGMKDGDKNFKLKGEMQKLFHLMYAQDLKTVVTTGPGVSRIVHMGDYQVALLDNRSFRDPNHKKNGDHFGVAQNYWLKKQLKNHKPTLIISGDQFWGEYHDFESFYGKHRKSFKKFVKELKKNKTAYAFISGDRHLSELQKIPREFLGYQTYEMTSSPIHSSLYPDRKIERKNERRVWAVSDQHNFMILEVFKANKDYLSLGASFWGQGGLLWKTPLKVDLSK